MAQYPLKSRFQWGQAIPLLVVLLLGGTFRLYLINQPFVDDNGWRESSTAMMAENIFNRWNIFYPEINWDGPGPSYNGREFQTVTFIAAVLYVFLGQEDWVGRFVGVAFGVSGIFALYKLTSLIWDRERALVAAAVMAVFPGSIFIDREFLPDPGMVALTTTGCWLFLVYLRTGRSIQLALAVAVSVLAFLTKITGLCVAIPMVYASRSSWSRNVQRTLRARILAVAGLLTIAPVILYYAWAWHLSRTYPPYHFAGVQDFVWNSGVHAWLGENYFLPKLYWHLKNIWTTLGLVLVLAALLLKPPQRVAGTGAMSRTHLQGRERFFHYWLLAAGGSYYLIGAAHLTNQPYNLHLFDPPAAALAGHTIVTVATHVRRYGGQYLAEGLAITAILAIGASGHSSIKAWYQPSSENAYRMGLALRQITEPEDLVVTFPESLGDPVALYYSRRHGWVFPPAFAWGEIRGDWDESIRSGQATRWLEELRARGARWLGIVRHQRDRIARLNPDLADYIQRQFELRSEHPDYLVYRAR